MIVLVSYGYNGGEFEGRPSIFVDASVWPSIPRGMNHLTGLNHAIQRYVLSNSVIRQLVHLLIAHVDTLANHLTTEEGAIVVAIQCKDGRHRSVATVELMAKELRSKGHTVTVQHRDLGERYG